MGCRHPAKTRGRVVGRRIHNYFREINRGGLRRLLVNDNTPDYADEDGFGYDLLLTLGREPFAQKWYDVPSI